MEAKNPHAVALGSITTPAKARAARANGKLGGRPPGSSGARGGSTLYALARLVAVQCVIPVPHCGRGRRIGWIRVESYKEIITWSVRKAESRGLWIRLSLRTTKPGSGIEADYYFGEDLLETVSSSYRATLDRSSGLDPAVTENLRAAFEKAHAAWAHGG
jgi:hypothetical protein